MELIGYIATCKVTGKTSGKVYLDKEEAQKNLLDETQTLKEVIIKGFEDNVK